MIYDQRKNSLTFLYQSLKNLLTHFDPTLKDHDCNKLILPQKIHLFSWPNCFEQSILRNIFSFMSYF